MMKKTIALLLMLCMVLCAGSALAVEVEIKHNNPNDPNQQDITIKKGQMEAGEYSLPTLEALNMQKPAWAKDFFGWWSSTDRLYHQPGEKITLKGDYVELTGYWTTENTILIEYLPGTGEGTKKTFPSERGRFEQLTHPQTCGFTSSKPFKAWLVEGGYEEVSYDYGSDVGRLLFARAIAAEKSVELQPEQDIKVTGPEKITVTALWGDEGSTGGNGGHAGGGNGGTGGNGGAGNLPKTGDESSLALWLTLVALCGVAMIALRKRANN